MTVKNSLINMTLCLGCITLVCSALLAVIYSVTQEPIAKAVQAKTNQTIACVSPDFDSFKELDGGLGYITLGASGDTVAYVINASSTGFGGKLSLMVGFRPDGTIYNTAVLSHSETPGLGAKCTEEGFASQFREFDPSQKSLTVKKDGGDVDAITASTITSRAYCAALGAAVESYRALAPRKKAVMDTASVAAPADSLAANTQIMEEPLNE